MNDLDIPNNRYIHCNMILNGFELNINVQQEIKEKKSNKTKMKSIKSDSAIRNLFSFPFNKCKYISMHTYIY